LQEWFDFKIPKTKIPEDFIFDALQDEANFNTKSNAKIFGKPSVEKFTKSKKGNSEMMNLTFMIKKESFTIQTNAERRMVSTNAFKNYCFKY
jgi:hypothetical protein